MVLVVGVCLLYGVLTLYPSAGRVLGWLFPAVFALFGVSLLFRYERGEPLTLIAGCLLVLGGIARTSYRFVPMGEFAGTAATLILFAGLLTELFAQHYRENG